MNEVKKKQIGSVQFSNALFCLLSIFGDADFSSALHGMAQSDQVWRILFSASDINLRQPHIFQAQIKKKKTLSCI